LANAALNDGKPISVGCARAGGIDGREFTISGIPAVDRVVDSLLQSEDRFAIRVIVETAGSDADESDNMSTRDFGAWTKMLPNAEFSTSVAFVIPVSTSAMRLATDLKGPQVQWLSDSTDVISTTPDTVYRKTIHLRTLDMLPHGSVLMARLTLLDSATGKMISQYERFAAFDTVPPVISSYRMLLFHDGQVAIQVQVGDQHSGVSARGVTTLLSSDGGRSWRRVVHRAIEDDFGRPAIFEAYAGLVPNDSSLLVAIQAQDLVGNWGNVIPDDATVWRVPGASEGALALPRRFLEYGNPVFAPEQLHQTTSLGEGATILGVSDRRHSNLTTDVFEARRVRELSEIVHEFAKWGIDPEHFDRVEASQKTFTIGSFCCMKGLSVEHFR
jgi:hypothetical protein